MKTVSKIVTLVILITVITTPALAWYPEYSVLATDFPVRNDFLRPLSMHSAASQGMGQYFQYIYQSQPDFRFMDPSYPLGKNGHILYMDLGAQRLWGRQSDVFSTVPMYYETGSYLVNDYAFWSPYREMSHENIPEPAFRLFYLTRLGESEGALTLGGSYSLAYDETQFYQPYNFNIFRSYDALGAAYDESQAYDDYRLREAGQDESVSTEHQVNLFLSKALSQRLTLGARLGLLRSEVDGNYGDFSFTDHSDYADEYVSYWEQDLKRLQTQKLNDFNLGIAYQTPEKMRIAINGGLTSGTLERSFSESDTNRYHSILLNPDADPTTADTNVYRSDSYFKSAKEWAYDGNGYYVRLLAELPQSDDLMVRLAATGEWRSADLAESETMVRRSDYYNQYWASWDSRFYRYDSQSRVSLDREGSGKYDSKLYHLSGGVDLKLQPELKFYGGLYYEYADRVQDAREPFTGDKWASTTMEGYNNPYENMVGTQTDLKTFVWEQHQRRSTVAVPLGVEYQIMPALGLQLGLTKVFQRLRVEEGYDVIVEEFHYTEIKDGVITRDDLDSDYVDGYQYPVIKEFSDRFEFNAGVSIHSSDRLKISVVLSNALQDEYAIKVGGAITW